MYVVLRGSAIENNSIASAINSSNLVLNQPCSIASENDLMFRFEGCTEHDTAHVQYPYCTFSLLLKCGSYISAMYFSAIVCAYVHIQYAASEVRISAGAAICASLNAIDRYLIVQLHC